MEGSSIRKLGLGCIRLGPGCNRIWTGTCEQTVLCSIVHHVLIVDMFTQLYMSDDDDESKSYVARSYSYEH